MTIEERIFRGIPVLVGVGTYAAFPPLVILSHGFARSKEDWRERIRGLVDRGYVVAALDNAGHGRRSGPDFQARANRNGKWEIREIRRLILETADDIRTVAGEFIEGGSIDPERIGLVGVSMGAFACLKALVSDKRFRATVSIIGSPYWDDLFDGTLEQNDPDLQNQLSTYALRHQPASFPDRFFPRAVLFQTGETDTHLNRDRVREFSQQLVRGYSSAPERIQYVEYRGVGHEFTEGMWEATLDWFHQFL